MENGFFRIAGYSAIALPCATVVMCVNQFVLPRLLKVRRPVEPIPEWRSTAFGNWPAIVAVAAAALFGAWGAGAAAWSDLRAEPWHCASRGMDHGGRPVHSICRTGRALPQRTDYPRIRPAPAAGLRRGISAGAGGRAMAAGHQASWRVALFYHFHDPGQVEDTRWQTMDPTCWKWCGGTSRRRRGQTGSCSW